MVISLSFVVYMTRTQLRAVPVMRKLCPFQGSKRPADLQEKKKTMLFLYRKQLCICVTPSDTADDVILAAQSGTFAVFLSLH